MSLSIGIVGLPNVGKSTLFTALTNKGGLAANYPFATIEPNVGIVAVPDKRLDALAEIDNPAKIVPATVEFVDIAGLVAGRRRARAWETSSWRTSARPTRSPRWRFFSDSDVTHVAGKVDPLSDVDTIKTELILADIATIEKALPRLEKEAKRDKANALKLDVARRVLEGLNEGHRARTLGLDEDESAAIYEPALAYHEPMLYIANVDEDAVDAELPRSTAACRFPSRRRWRPISPAELRARPEEAAEYMEALGLAQSGLARLIHEAYARFWGCRATSPAAKPRRAWTIPSVRKAPQAEASSTPTSSAVSSRPRRRASRITWRSAERRAAATRASCAKRARTTWCKTATSCTSSSTCRLLEYILSV